jgi:hypothetical protein
MTELRERDAMICRACGREERASEGYPCADCGRFICNMCNMRGVTLCGDCSAKTVGTAVPTNGNGGSPVAPEKVPTTGA